MIRRCPIPIILLSVILIKSGDSAAIDLYADVSIDNTYTSNVYLDRQQEWDNTLSPQLLMGMEFPSFLSLEYAGRADFYFRHTDLLFQRHGLHFFFEPTWGEDDENTFITELALMTQRNTDAYETIDFVEPSLDLALLLEPSDWLRWSVSCTGSYRLFYNETESDSLDLWAGGSITFTIPSKTTVGPHFRYGFRYYPRQDLSLTDDTEDQQIETGIHISQGLKTRSGLKADYTYLHAIGNSGLIERNLTHTEFSYIGQDFLYSGHRIELGFKQLFDLGWSIGIDLRYEYRDYHGWEIEDQGGTGNGPGSAQVEVEDRKDSHLAPALWVAYTWLPSDSASNLAPDITIKLGYGYLRQWSNDRLYDSDRHLVTLGLEASW